MKNDYDFLYREFYLALKGRFTTSPNPNVGCVIVNDGSIVCEGYNFKSGGLHAEILALNMVRGKAKGATVYITLEQCSHYVLNPPCVNTLVEAGITRVVSTIQDPNPKISGNGFAKLKKIRYSINHWIEYKKS